MRGGHWGSLSSLARLCFASVSDLGILGVGVGLEGDDPEVRGVDLRPS